jgi:pyruvyltransferase
MKVFYFTSDKPVNIGDALSPVILEHFTDHKPELASSDESGKLLLIGSLLDIVSDNDIVCGIGSNKPNFTLEANDTMRFISVRGPLTRFQIKGADVPKNYGDPALLLPLMYFPKIEKKKKTGIIPHYVDKKYFPKDQIIDIEQDYKTFVDQILECDEIISSSLHGIIIAEAYGIKTKWVMYGDKIEGGEFKYQDYFLGTGRPIQEQNKRLDKIKDLKGIQDRILSSLKKI